MLCLGRRNRWEECVSMVFDKAVTNTSSFRVKSNPNSKERKQIEAHTLLGKINGSHPTKKRIQ